MKKRIITGAVLMAVLIPLIVIDHKEYPIVGPLFLVLGIFLSIVASFEMMNMFDKKYNTIGIQKYIIPVFSGMLVLSIYLEIDEYYKENLNLNLVVPLFLLFVVLSLAITIFTEHSTVHDMMACIITLAYAGLIMGYVIGIRFLEPFPTDEGIIHLRGGRSFGYLYSIVIATDMFAYLIGVKFGKNKLCPEISPKKTVEGAIGGLIAGSLFGVGSAFLFKIVTPSSDLEIVFSIVVALLISMVLSIAVQIGDLVASKMKRSFEIKDFGKIFPGHGGVLDRFDSLLYAGACYYIIAEIMQLIW